MVSDGAGSNAAKVAARNGKLQGEKDPNTRPDLAGSKADSEYELEALAEAENAFSRPLSQALISLNRKFERRQVHYASL